MSGCLVKRNLRLMMFTRLSSRRGERLAKIVALNYLANLFLSVVYMCGQVLKAQKVVKAEELMKRAAGDTKVQKSISKPKPKARRGKAKAQPAAPQQEESAPPQASIASEPQDSDGAAEETREAEPTPDMPKHPEPSALPAAPAVSDPGNSVLAVQGGWGETVPWPRPLGCGI